MANVPDSKNRRSVLSSCMDRSLPVLFVLALATICFIGGAYVAEFDVPIYKTVLEPSFRGMRALREDREMEQGWRKYGWLKARHKQSGTTVYEPELACDGLTLYASSGGGLTTAQLISMKGEVVHRWSLPFRDAWPDPPHVSKPVPEERIYWHTARLLPNGDLLAVYNALAGSLYGYGLVKMDKDSKLVWRYSEGIHHDFDVDDQGKVYAIGHKIEHQSVETAPHLRTPYLSDYVAVLSPDGKELKRISIFSAFANSKFGSYLQSLSSNEKGDHTHANGISVIPEGFAKKNGFCSTGDVMISVRNPSLLAIIDINKESVVWAANGIWLRQHDPDALENGHVLVFDNLGNLTGGGKSRILEWNPSNGAIEWQYSGNQEQMFESLTRGCQQLLPNGNVLVTESNNGRLFEVTRDQKIVWEFCSPDRSGDKNEFVAMVTSGRRYRPHELTFLDSAGGRVHTSSNLPRTAGKKRNIER